MKIKQESTLTGRNKYSKFTIKAETSEERRSLSVAIDILKDSPEWFNGLLCKGMPAAVLSKEGISRVREARRAFEQREGIRFMCLFDKMTETEKQCVLGQRGYQVEL